MTIEPDVVRGFHGPDSAMWRINREAVLLGAGPTALLLQIAHPLVGEAVAAHSAFRTDPLARLRRTLMTTLDIVFGDGRTAAAAVARLNRIHAAIDGTTTDPATASALGSMHATAYSALDPELLLWVQSTLIVTSVRAYAAWVAPLSDADREAFWQEARQVGTLLGIPLEHSPARWEELEAWFERMLRPEGPIHVTPTTRAMAHPILHPGIPFVPGRALDIATLPGLSLLPSRLRREFGIEWTAMRRLTAATLSHGIRTWVRFIPSDVRAMPQARAAERRCRSARSHGSSATIASATS